MRKDTRHNDKRVTDGKCDQVTSRDNRVMEEVRESRDDLGAGSREDKDSRK